MQDETTEVEVETKNIASEVPVASWRAFRSKAVAEGLTVPQALDRALQFWVSSGAA